MHSQHYSFVVRVWLEGTYTEQETAIWRGSIEQVGHDGRMYFSDLGGITRYIEAQIGWKDPPLYAGLRARWEHMKNGLRKFWKRVVPRSH